MAEGDGVANQGIRVRLGGTATERDIGALRKWLEREQPLDERVRAGELRMYERPGTDGTGAPMGVGMDILLVVTGAGAAVFFEELLGQVKRAVSAWLANRGAVETGDPPAAEVEPVNVDDR
ncbi:hypothetical protein ACIF9R_10855 [Streptomyces sp. NPDC086080]|uniref:effector-associated constant component EACC1 n=1 Tax=Streptomyces sp. NPDC086080 TaxID=3365748 RepID=UPI0037CECE67